MNTRRPTKTALPPNDAPRRGPLNRWLVLSVVLACLAGGLMIVGYELMRTKSTGATAENRQSAPSPEVNPAADRSAKRNVSAGPSNIIDDDGKTMWVSPTSGPPLDLAFLPPGCQIVVALRPESLAGQPEFDKVLDSVGPIGLRGAQFLDDALHTPQGVASVLLGYRMKSDGTWDAALVARLTGRLTAAEHLAAKLPNTVKENYSGQTYWVDDQRAYYLPTGADSKLMVIASSISIKEIIELGGNPPPLRRDVERLLADTDADRHFTVIVAPNFLFGEGQSVFSGAMARLREPLFWFLGDSLNAVALSMNWDENFFIELLAMPTLDTPPAQAARQLAGRVSEMPDHVENYVLGLDPQPYGRQIIARFPGMLRKLANYTRSGVEADHVVMRCYLPAVAGHNLLLGAELTLAELPAEKSPAAEAGAPVVAEAKSISELLKRPTSLRFARDSLDAAIDQLSQDSGIEIIILGPDLQADGITRNQQLAIDVENRPADEILVEILRSANPDKTATGPADPRQKLVYVMKPKSPGDVEAVFVTTRAKAAERGEELPPAFVAKPGTTD